MSKGGFLDPYKDTIVKIAVQQVMAVLVTKLPFLTFGPLNAVAAFVLSKLIKLILEQTILGLNFAYIDITNDMDARKIKELLEKIKTVPPENKEERDAIEKDIIDKARDLIKLRSKPPF